MSWLRNQQFGMIGQICFNLETAVGRARWGIQAGGWRDATTPHAVACKEEQQSQTPAWTFQRARSGLTQQVRCAEGSMANIHGLLQG